MYYDIDRMNARIKNLEEMNADKAKTIEELKKKLLGKVLIVEDGSVDKDRLELDGFYVITYRQGSSKPEWLKGGVEC